MKGSWTEDVGFLDLLAETVLYTMSAYPRKLVHTDELVHRHNLPFSQIQLLSLLSTQDVTVTEAARHLNVAKTNLALLVRQLSDKGYVERIQNTQDRRKAFLHMTPRGREEYNKLKFSVTEQLKKLAGEFSRSEIKLLQKSLSQINHVLFEL